MQLVSNQCLGIDYKPIVLIADAASSITRGFDKSFQSNDYDRVVCWAHVFRNIKKKLAETVSKKEERDKILEDIYKLHSCPSRTVFKKASELFINKWNVEKNFIKYFSKQWLTNSRSGWYVGISIGVPCENNALESNNRYNKKCKYSDAHRAQFKSVKPGQLLRLKKISIPYKFLINRYFSNNHI